MSDYVFAMRDPIDGLDVALEVEAALEAEAANSQCGCCSNITGRPPTPAVALWTSRINGHTVALCQSCLDFWFDGADEDAEAGDAEMEPCRVQWLDGSRTLVAAADAAD